MKKVIFLLLFLITSLSLTSCMEGSVRYVYHETDYVSHVPYYYSGLGLRNYYYVTPHVVQRPIVIHSTPRVNKHVHVSKPIINNRRHNVPKNVPNRNIKRRR